MGPQTSAIKDYSLPTSIILHGVLRASRTLIHKTAGSCFQLRTRCRWLVILEMTQSLARLLCVVTLIGTSDKTRMESLYSNDMQMVIGTVGLRRFSLAILPC